MFYVIYYTPGEDEPMREAFESEIAARRRFNLLRELGIDAELLGTLV